MRVGALRRPTRTPLGLTLLVLFLGTFSPVAYAAPEANNSRWYAVTLSDRYIYEIRLTQKVADLDLHLALFKETPDGSCVRAGEAMYGGLDKRLWLSHPDGRYWICVSAGDAEKLPAPVDYDLMVWVPAASGNLLIVSTDLLSQTNPPPNTVAMVDGSQNQQSFGANLSVVFSGLSAGAHTVQVTTAAAGYLPDTDPNTPGQQTNRASSYGNPRILQVIDNSWNGGTFNFGPFMTANGLVRDAWTTERIQGASIAFVAKNGSISNAIYEKYPNYATYSTNWATLVDGSFPTNVLLPPVTWDIWVTNSGYHDLYITNIIVNPLAADVKNLGTVFLVPIDSNSNHLGDVWESRYFGAATNVSALDDPDHDGANNGEEYLAGTDPTNPCSVFEFDDFDLDSNAGIRVSWPVSASRTYRLVARSRLNDPSDWFQVDGTWERTTGHVMVDNKLRERPSLCVRANRFTQLRWIKCCTGNRLVWVSYERKRGRR